MGAVIVTAMMEMSLGRSYWLGTQQLIERQWDALDKEAIVGL
jgi:hypothetical protein